MRTQKQTYDHLLRVQARISFHYELGALRQNPQWEDAATVLDYGCGNGAFARFLALAYPEKQFICLDKDPTLTKFASVALGNFKNVSVVTTNYQSRPSIPFDFLLLRHVTSYLTDRPSFFKWAFNSARPGAGIAIIDADETNLSFKPRLPIYEAGMQRFRDELEKKGGKRDLLGLIAQELAQDGFIHDRTERLIIHSNLPHTKELFYLLMTLVAEFDYGSPLRQDLAEELYSWVLDDTSYGQYGIFASLYLRRS